MVTVSCAWKSYVQGLWFDRCQAQMGRNIQGLTAQPQECSRLGEQVDSLQTNSSLEFWIIYLRLGFGFIRSCSTMVSGFRSDQPNIILFPAIKYLRHCVQPVSDQYVLGEMFPLKIFSIFNSKVPMTKTKTLWTLNSNSLVLWTLKIKGNLALSHVQGVFSLMITHNNKHNLSFADMIFKGSGQIDRLRLSKHTLIRLYVYLQQ